MNLLTRRIAKQGTHMAGLAISSLLIVACATTPASPRGAAEVRAKLTALQNNPELSSQARGEFREAETAVRIAEQPLPKDEMDLGTHRVYMADRKVSIAEARARTRFAEEQRTRLGEERDEARLQARTREADRARDDADMARDEATRARNETAIARSESARARSDADTARDAKAEAAAVAAREALEYQRQIDVLQAATTERGLVLTLGDVLFATGSSELQSGANRNLDKLVSFLNLYPERRVIIEGHTDNVGNTEYNRRLSQRRADSVMSYLAQRGIASRSLSASGIGMHRPVASNNTASGRQQNRRVEIIIENPPKP